MWQKMIPYAGSVAGQAPNSNSSAQNVRDLTEHIRGSGRNVTMDRYYTSVELAEELASERNLTVVGAIQPNRRHVPDAFKSATRREVFSTKFDFSGDCLLASYVPK